MPINKLYGGGFEVLRNALNLRSERQGLIQSNIANRETPGYNVQDFDFKKVMETVLTGQGGLARTDSRHLAMDPVEISLRREFKHEERPVDLDEEMVKLSENQLMYQVATRIISKKFEGLRFVIDEGGK
jgi:flagellar basal-body rod protein FlgB